jgi:hypothetical protein
MGQRRHAETPDVWVSHLGEGAAGVGAVVSTNTNQRSLSSLFWSNTVQRSRFDLDLDSHLWPRAA